MKLKKGNKWPIAWKQGWRNAVIGSNADYWHNRLFAVWFSARMGPDATNSLLGRVFRRPNIFSHNLRSKYTPTRYAETSRTCQSWQHRHRWREKIYAKYRRSFTKSLKWKALEKSSNLYRFAPSSNSRTYRLAVRREEWHFEYREIQSSFLQPTLLIVIATPPPLFGNNRSMIFYSLIPLIWSPSFCASLDVWHQTVWRLWNVWHDLKFNSSETRLKAVNGNKDALKFAIDWRTRYELSRSENSSFNSMQAFLG